MAKGFDKLYEDSVKILQRKREQALKRANTVFFNNLRAKYEESGQTFSLYYFAGGNDYFFRDAFGSYADAIAYIEKSEISRFVREKDKPHFMKKLNGIRNVLPIKNKPSRFVCKHEGKKHHEIGYEIRLGDIDDIIERIVDEVDRCEKLHVRIESRPHHYYEED